MSPLPCESFTRSSGFGERAITLHYAYESDFMPRGSAHVGPHVLAGTLWYMILTILALKEAAHPGWGKSLVLSLLGFAANESAQWAAPSSPGILGQCGTG